MFSLFESVTWIRDLDEEIANLRELAQLRNRSVLITGGTGLIGSAVVDLLIRYNETTGAENKIILAGRNVDRMKLRFMPYSDQPYMDFVLFDTSKTTDSPELTADYIIHCASNASPDLIVKEPVETMMSNIIGLKVLLDQARKHSSQRILLVSSSEVYGNKDNDLPFREDEYGFVDILSSRNSYSVAKRAAETLCISYYDEYGVESVIVRPGHIYGPTATESDRRVSSAWAYAAARGEDIIMKSDGAQVRSYCYCLDCATAILKAMITGKSGHAYNVSNPDSVISIREMAELLAKSGGVQLKMEKPTDTERKRFNPMKNSSLDASALMDLGWKGIFDAKTGFFHTVSVIRERI